MTGVGIVCAATVAGFLLISGAAKFVDIPGVVSVIRTIIPHGSRTALLLLACLVPTVECVCGVAVWWSPRLWSLGSAAVVWASLSAVKVVLVARREGTPCHCMGSLVQTRATASDLVWDGGQLVLVGIALAATWLGGGAMQRRIWPPEVIALGSSWVLLRIVAVVARPWTEAAVNAGKGAGGDARI